MISVPVLSVGRFSGRRRIPRRVQGRVPLFLAYPEKNAELLRVWAVASVDHRQRIVRTRLAAAGVDAEERRILRDYLAALRREKRDATSRRRKERQKEERARPWKNWHCRRFGRKRRLWETFVRTPFGAKFQSIAANVAASLGALVGGRR